MAGTLASELALEHGRWIAYLTVAGWGRRYNATTAARRMPFRFCTSHPYDHGYTAANAGQYQENLAQLDAVLEERINLREATTDLGGLTFRLTDHSLRTLTGEPALGWDATDPITDFLAVQYPATAVNLTAEVTAATATWAVASVASYSVGDVLHIDAEAVVITAVPGGGGPLTIDVIRAVLGTTAAPHYLRTSVPSGEGVIYDRPQYIRNRYVELWINLFDSRYEDVLMPEANALRVWTGLIDDWEQGDGGSVLFTAKAALGRMDRTIGRQQWRGTVFPHEVGDRVSEAEAQALVQKMQDQQDIVWKVQAQQTEGTPRQPEYPDANGGGINADTYCHMRLGDQIVDMWWTRPVGYTGPMAMFWTVRYGLNGTVPTISLDQAAEGLPCWDVLLTHPTPSGLETCYFRNAAGTQYTHPADIALALITSTGTAPWGGIGTNGAWDCLPAPWGAGVPIALVDTASFVALRDRTTTVKMPRHVLGWDGKPFRLRRWIEENLLAPLGWYLILDESGLISARSIDEQYPSESWPAIGEGDIIEVGAQMPKSLGMLQETTSYQTVNYDFDLKSGKPRQTLVYRHPQAYGRGSEDDNEITINCRGIEPSSAVVYLQARATSNARWWVTPHPVVRLSVGTHMLGTAVTDGVVVTCSTAMNPFTGSRGLAAQPAVVVSRSVDLPNSVIHLDLMLLPTPALGLWTPSATVVAVTADVPGVPRTVTVSIQANYYTGAEAQPGVPATDAAAWRVGDVAMLTSVRCAVLDPLAWTVSVVGANSLTLTTLSAVVPVATNVFTFQHYQGSAINPAGAWTASMLVLGTPQASAAGVLPDGTAGRVYGGL